MRSVIKLLPGVAILAGVAFAATYAGRTLLGRQPDGTFIVSTGQHIDAGTIPFDGRPMDLALHPSEDLMAILNQNSIILADHRAVIEGAIFKTEAGASYRGCVWSPDGKELYVSLSKGGLQHFHLDDRKLISVGRIGLIPSSTKQNPVPGGMVFTKDGSKLFVACANLGAVVEVDTSTDESVKTWKVQNIPFDVRLDESEKNLIVSNWAGKESEKKDKAKEDDDDDVADSAGVSVQVDKRGIVSTGTVSLIDRASEKRTDINVGLHPAGLAVSGSKAYVANAGSDTVSEIDITAAKVSRTFRLEWQGRKLFGSMPNTLAVSGDKLFACGGGDNAIAEIDLRSGKVLGFRPAGYFPVGIQVSKDGNTAFVVNTKGNGSVRETIKGKVGTTHQFQGTVSVIDLKADLTTATTRVAQNNSWEGSLDARKPPLKVYNGAIKHVLYIIKENRTYDQIFGDMPQGNGDPKLCGLGEEVTPNHHALAREFTLFDNAYTSGTNSAEGHQWAMEGLANDYIERFYGGYSRSYPYDGGDPMAYASSGFIWDAAAKRGKSIRIYGEFCNADGAKLTPRPKSWLDAWQDRESGANRIDVRAYSSVQGMRKYLHPNVICWPLLMSDQWRADKFISEYEQFSKQDKVPNLMILTLPSDHTEGTSPSYPKPRSMVADNDLALGRVVEAISKSPQWKDTCIFVMEDDSQAGPDHVDGHRTVCLAISPYTRRGFVDSSLYTQISILRSIELMLGLDPMNRFDAVAMPFNVCFVDEPDTKPYTVVPNKVRLDDMNPPLRALKGKERYWAEQSASLDWSGVDTADWYTLNRVLWHNLHGVDTPYPTN